MPRYNVPMAAMRQRGTDRERNFRGRVILRRLPEIHGDDDAQIIVSADHAVDRRDDHQPDDGWAERGVRIECGLKREEFAEETAGRGQAQQRKQEQRETNREHRLPRAEAGVVRDFEMSFILLAEVRDDQERPDFHERIRRQIEQYGRRRRKP